MPTAQEPDLSLRPSGRSGTDNPVELQGADNAPNEPPAARTARQIADRITDVSWPPPEPGGPAGDLLLAYLRTQFLALLAEDLRVREDRDDAVHKMRVSTRRMRSALASYRRVLAPEPARTVRRELKWLAGVLGAARDAQVLRARLQALIATQPAELVLGPVQQQIDEELLGAFRSAHAEVLRVLDGERYRQLLDRVETVVSHPDFTAAAAVPAAETAERMLHRDRKRLHRQVRAARRDAGTGEDTGEDAGEDAGEDTVEDAGENTGENQAESLHKARKEAKRLRYAAEVAEPVYPAGAAELVAGAEHVQKILGEHQDSVVSRVFLRRLGAASAGPGSNGFTCGRLHALEEKRGEAASRRFSKAWAHFPRVV